MLRIHHQHALAPRRIRPPLDGWLATNWDENNRHVFDAWSMIHFAMGFGAGSIGLGIAPYVLLATGYELVEYHLEFPSGSILFGSKNAETLSNVIADMALGIGGFYLASKVVMPRVRERAE